MTAPIHNDDARPRSQDHVLNVCEIFASIQGESTCSGLPCVFVRLTGCNLRCVYCDTAYSLEDGYEMTADEVIEAVCSYHIGLVEITGGEPLLQEGVFPLVTSLLDLGFAVLIETNGTVSVRALDHRAVVIMDVKCPSSGMAGRTDMDNIAWLRQEDEVKFVLSGRADYEWAKCFVTKHALIERCKVLFSPVYGILRPAELAGWIVADSLAVRLNLQIHKYIFGPDVRGV